MLIFIDEELGVLVRKVKFNDKAVGEFFAKFPFFGKGFKSSLFILSGKFDLEDFALTPNRN